MKKIIDKHPLLIFMILLLTAVTLGASQYYPVHLRKQTLQQTLHKLEDKLDEIQGYSEKLPMLHREVKDLEPRSVEFRNRVPANQQFSQLWHQIAEIMNQNQLSDQLVRPGEVICGGDFCSIPLEIKCSGTLQDFFEFFHAMEQFDRLIRMEEVHMRNDAEVSGQLELHVKASVFYQLTETQT